MASYAAFLSYSSRYGEWVAALHRNLERCLRHAGIDQPVFLDQVDLASGRSWLRQLQAAVDQTAHFVLIATPEAVASPRVADEVEGFITRRRDWSAGHFHLVLLVEAPLSPFLETIQYLDFRRYDDGAYRRELSRLAAGLMNRAPRDLPELPAGIEVPLPPTSTLPGPQRSKLVDVLVPFLGTKPERRAVATSVGLDKSALEDHPSLACAASAASSPSAGPGPRWP